MVIDTVDGKDNQEEDIKIIGLLLPLADVRLLLLPHVDVVNIGDVTQFEAVKHF